MDVYTEYCINQAMASRVLQSLRQSNLELAACLQVRAFLVLHVILVIDVTVKAPSGGTFSAKLGSLQLPARS